MKISCSEYYEKYLGDCCNNRCYECFAEKTIYVNTQDLYLSGETIVHRVKVKKGTWWRELFRNKTHIVLENLEGNSWYISWYMFDKYFKE